jgi:hypothetical protein
LRFHFSAQNSDFLASRATLLSQATILRAILAAFAAEISGGIQWFTFFAAAAR